MSVSNKKIAFVLAKERAKNLADEFQDVGFFDEDYFYEDFFKKEFGKEVINHVLIRLERAGYIHAYMIKDCSNCDEKAFQREEDYFHKKTFNQLASNKKNVQCTNCGYSINFKKCDWKFAFSQDVLTSSDQQEENTGAGVFQKIRNFLRIGR